jgi:hypothetical protein
MTSVLILLAAQSTAQSRRLRCRALRGAVGPVRIAQHSAGEEDYIGVAARDYFFRLLGFGDPDSAKAFFGTPRKNFAPLRETSCISLEGKHASRKAQRRKGSRTAALESRRALQQLPEHIWQNPAVQVVVNLDWCVDAQG